MFSLSRRVLDDLWPVSALATPYLPRYCINQPAYVGRDSEAYPGLR